MKIVSLEAENFKRLRAVEITPGPDGSLVVVAGRNAQGKTSVLDSIAAALGGASASKLTTRPIRDGEKDAAVRVDLGDIVVTRTWTPSGSKLVVEAADGARYPKPQQFLDDLIGKLSFDPLAFTQLSDKAQLETLLSLVDLPFDPAVLAGERARLFEARTEVGRDLKAATARLQAMPEVNPDGPTEEVSTADLMAEYQRANALLASNSAERSRLRDAEDRREGFAAAIERLQAELAEAFDSYNQAEAEVSTLQAKVEGLVDPDVESIQARTATVEETNAAIRLRSQRAEVHGDMELASAKVDDLTAQIANVDARKAEGLAAAAMPIEGLGFDDEGVTYLGVPLKQASGAEQLRVSMAIGMAGDPTIRVILIKDGSLLDPDNLALISEMAGAHDFQIWCERVGDTDGIGVVIEDGAVLTTEAVDLFEGVVA